MRNGDGMVDLNKLGDRFLAFKKIGEETRMIIGRRVNDTTSDWKVYEHRDVDGVGVIVSEIEKTNKVLSVPEMRNPIRPNLFKLIYLFFKYIKWASGARPIWNEKYDWDKVGSPENSSLFYFSKSESEQIKEYCKNEKISPTSFFLDAIDNSLSESLLNLNERKWVVPINVRGFIGEKIEKRNLSVVCQLRLSGKESNEKKIQNDLKTFLVKGLHWGGWVSLVLQSKMSQKMMLNILKKHKNIAHGLFTNIGSWPELFIEGDYQDHLALVIPSSRLMPISCLLMEFHGQFQLNLSFHPSLGVGTKEQELKLKGWINNCFRKLNLDKDSILIENIPIKEILSKDGPL